MMWRVSPDHGENDVTGKRRLLGRSKNEVDFSSAIRELAGGNMNKDLVRVGNTGAPALRRALTPAQFGDLAQVPPELEWLANLTNPKTRRAYKIDVEEFIAFAGLGGFAELRAVTRAHVIAWRKDLETRTKRGLN
jgi:hypothetical protein